jgi:hypothetical protein
MLVSENSAVAAYTYCVLMLLGSCIGINDDAKETEETKLRRQLKYEDVLYCLSTVDLFCGDRMMIVRSAGV